MSYKFDSLMIILNKLDSRGKVTARTLMNDLEVSERTVYRYLETLQVAGFPIYYDREKESYVFTEGYSLRMPDLSVEETLAFALAKSLLSNFGTGMEESLNSIEKKLSVKNTELPKHIVLSAERLPSEAEKYLGTIHQAIIDFQRIEIVYKALYSNEETLRTVDPYYLFHQEGFWHLRGYCHLREDFRTFALDRIGSLKILDKHFLPKSISPEDELSGAFGSVVDGDPVEVVLRFDTVCKPYILRKKWHQSQEVKELEGGSLEMKFIVNGYEGIKQWIYKWIPHVEVIAPEELREFITDELREALKRHDYK